MHGLGKHISQLRTSERLTFLRVSVDLVQSLLAMNV
jgi:hypothetical protein